MTKWITVSLASSPGLGQGGDAALGAADRGAGDVELGGELVAAGDDELRRQLDLAHVAVDPLLELGDHLLGGAADAVFEPLGRLRRGRQLGAGDEEVVLEAEDVGGQLASPGPQRARATPSCEQASSSVP